MTTTTLAVGGDVPLELVDGKAPTELRLLRRGINPSTKGDFVFDDQAADAVMSTYRQMGRGWVIADYDHGSLQSAPVDPSRSSRAAGRARLELRDGDLWAADVKWTPDAKAAIEAGEWPSISPAFEHGDDRRPTWLINFGLTGNPALHAPAELIAANVLRVAMGAVTHIDDDLAPDAPAIAPNKGLGPRRPTLQESAPTIKQPGHAPETKAKAVEKLSMKTRTPAEVAEFFGVTEDEAKMMISGYAEMAAAKQQGETMMSAVCLSVGLSAGTKQSDVVSRLSALTSFERSVLTATGEQDCAKALGAITGLISTQAQAQAAIAELATVKATNMKAGIEAQLSAAKAEKKLTPAEFDDQSETGLRATALSMGEKGEGWLKAHLAKRVPHPVLSTVYTQPKTEPDVDGVAADLDKLTSKDFGEMSWTERSELNAKAPKVYAKLHAQWRSSSGAPKRTSGTVTTASLVRELPDA